MTNLILYLLHHCSNTLLFSLNLPLSFSSLLLVFFLLLLVSLLLLLLSLLSLEEMFKKQRQDCQHSYMLWTYQDLFIHNNVLTASCSRYQVFS